MYNCIQGLVQFRARFCTNKVGYDKKKTINMLSTIYFLLHSYNLTAKRYLMSLCCFILLKVIP